MTDKTHIEFDGLGFSPAITEQGLAAWKSMQQELLEFMGRRAQACAKWTSDVSRCRTPQDLWHEQLRFVKEMVSDCESAGDRLMTTFVASSRLDPPSKPTH